MYDKYQKGREKISWRRDFKKHWKDLAIKKFRKNYTNIYAAKYNTGKGRPWKELTLSELQIQLGILIYTGIFKASSIKDYWNQTEQFQNYIILIQINGHVVLKDRFFLYKHLVKLINNTITRIF